MSKIHPSTIIDASSIIDENVIIGPFCIIGKNCRIGSDSILKSHVIIADNCTIGKNNIFSHFTSIGGNPHHKQFSKGNGGVIIGNHNNFFEYVTINSGIPEFSKHTLIGNGNFFMAGSHVGHDCKIANSSTFAPNVLLGGHVKIDDNVFIGGNSAVKQFVNIGRFAMISGLAPVSTNVIPFGYVGIKIGNLIGINRIGLKRAKFSTQQIKAIQSIYFKLFKEKDILFQERLKKLEQENLSEEQQEIINFIRNSSMAICKPL